MPLYPLPPASELTTTGITKGTFKGALNGMRAFLNSLLGSTGSQADALTALGALLNGSVPVSAAGTTVGATHRGKLFDCTGTGGWTLAVDACATLGAGFPFAVRNSTSGTVTINPNLSEPIDDASTLDLAPGETCLVQVNADATGLKTVGRTAGSAIIAQTKLTSGTTHPLNPRTTHVVVEVVGGGGGGAGDNGYGYGGGSGGAGSHLRTNLIDTGGAGTISYAIGSGGAGGAAHASGGAGGNSTVTVNGTTFTAYGGGGGTTPPGGGGSPGTGGAGGAVDTNYSSRFAMTGQSGMASSPWVGGESAFSGKAAASAAGVYGGGGGGGAPTYGAGGAGGGGMLIITEYRL